MNALPPITEPAADFALAAPAITIIYDDCSTGLRAKRFCDRLAASLGGQPQNSPACWRSDLIELPLLASEVTRDAAASEFLILSLRGDRELKESMKQWLESWLAGAAGGRSMLIALFDTSRSAGPHAEGIRSYLRNAAAGASIAFFAHCTLSANEGASALRSRAKEGGAEPKRRRRTQIPVASYFPAHLAA